MAYYYHLILANSSARYLVEIHLRGNHVASLVTAEQLHAVGAPLHARDVVTVNWPHVKLLQLPTELLLFKLTPWQLINKHHPSVASSRKQMTGIIYTYGALT